MLMCFTARVCQEFADLTVGYFIRNAVPILLMRQKIFLLITTLYGIKTIKIKKWINIFHCDMLMKKEVKHKVHEVLDLVNISEMFLGSNFL